MEIEKIIPGGMGLATAKDGKKWFFWNALPGETITNYETIKIKSTYAEAVMLDIIHPSPHRVKAKDACFLATSPWQVMDYDYELALKSDIVQEIFREHQIIIEKPPVLTDHHPYFYRNKMEYSLYYAHEDHKIHLGFHQRGTHRKFPISQSSIERPEIWTRATEIVDELNRTHADARRYQSLLLRSSQSGIVSGGLLENHRAHPTFENLTDTILGHEYSYSPNGFFQINPPVYELALQSIQTYINTDRVLDLYAGVGTIGLSVARDRQLTLVEVDKSAYAELVRNCGASIPTKSHSDPTSMSLSSHFAQSDPATAQNFPPRPGIFNHPHPILAKSEDALDYIKSDQTVIVDPPRAGLHPALVDKFLDVTPPTIIYLSCNPATQARDVKALLSKYQIASVQAFNFFPRTPHIENLVILTRKI